MRIALAIASGLGMMVIIGTSASAEPVVPADSAGDSLEEISVTAEKRAEGVEKIPLSVAVISGDAAMKQGQVQLDQVMAGVGGVKVLEGEAGPAFYIRGIGTGVPPSVGDPEINLSVDGVYQSQPEFSRAGLYDVNRIEVLRGPQGTLYGRNALAGAVNVVTNDPTFTVGAAGSIGFGNYGLIQSQGMVNTPLGDKIAVRAAFGSENRNGYLTNGADDASIQSERLKILFKPTGSLTVLLAADNTVEGGQGEGEIQVVAPPKGFPVGGAGQGDVFASANPWTSPDPGDATRHTEFWSVRLQIDWDLGVGILTAIPAFRSDEYSCLSCWRSETDQNNHSAERQTTAELRLASQPASTTTWLTGLYYLRSSNPTATQQLGPGADSFSNSSANPVSEQGQVAFDSTSYAVFGQASYPIVERLRVTGGARYTIDDKSETAYVSSETGGVTTISTGYFSATHAWHSLTYNAGLAYDLSDTSMTYAKVSTGYKAGGFYEGAPPNSYDPEHLTSYEAGAKARLLDKRLEVNADAFWYVYDDYQVNYLGVINPTNAGIFGVLTANAAGARIYGAELETRFHLSRADAIDAALYPLHSQFKALVIGGPFGGNYSGLPLPFAPQLSGKLGYQHAFHLQDRGAITARLEANYESRSWVTFSEASGTHQPGHALSNAYLSYDAPNGAWSLSCYVKNLENTPVLVNAQGGPAGLETADIGPPRTFGLQIAAKLSR
jgi:iron complex outermembrane receptor protein